jgi:predicted aspartyl protease
MSTAFNAQRGLVIVRARVWGPTGTAIVRLALDTGASTTLVRTAILVSLGYDPANALERVQVTTGSSVEFLPRLRIEKLQALGQSLEPVDVLCHTLPPTSLLDGVLGLSFLRGKRLVIDFRKGLINLS